MKIRSVGPLSVGKMMGAIYGALGLLFGFFFAIFSIVGGLIAANERGALAGLPPVAAGIAALVFLPIIYGGMGFVLGALSALLYNLAARIMGGIEVELGE